VRVRARVSVRIRTKARARVRVRVRLGVRVKVKVQVRARVRARVGVRVGVHYILTHIWTCIWQCMCTRIQEITSVGAIIDRDEDGGSLKEARAWHTRSRFGRVENKFGPFEGATILADGALANREVSEPELRVAVKHALVAEVDVTLREGDVDAGDAVHSRSNLRDRVDVVSCAREVAKGTSFRK
tara:strand:+ start:54 stop:608 length:555 start_codon:yes stop_codon:yes gene_type:complete